jgi:hypothetical protein
MNDVNMPATPAVPAGQSMVVPPAPQPAPPPDPNTANIAKGYSKSVQDAMTLDVVYALTPLFKQKYVQNLKGKEFVKYNGLLTLAKVKGIKSLKVKVIQFPNPDNNHTAICEAYLVGWDKAPDKSMIEVEYSEIGDANVTNCSSGVAAHYVRMAATRAKGRALRDYLGIDSVMEEEMMDLDSTPGAASMLQAVDKAQIGGQPIAGQPDIPITQQQINDVNQLLGQLGWTGEMFQGFVGQMFPQLGDMSTMSNLQANHLIGELKKQAGVF